MEKKFYITHYYTRPVEKLGWSKLAYLTSTEENLGKGIYHNGPVTYRDIPENVLNEMIDDGILTKLPSPEFINKNQGLWLTENSEVYLADKVNPRGDNPKKLLGIEELLEGFKIILNPPKF